MNVCLRSCFYYQCILIYLSLEIYTSYVILSESVINAFSILEGFLSLLVFHDTQSSLEPLQQHPTLSRPPSSKQNSFDTPLPRLCHLQIQYSPLPLLVVHILVQQLCIALVLLCPKYLPARSHSNRAPTNSLNSSPLEFALMCRHLLIITP